MQDRDAQLGIELIEVIEQRRKPVLGVGEGHLNEMGPQHAGDLRCLFELVVLCPESDR